MKEAEKRALDPRDCFHPDIEPWEISAVIALVALAIMWLVRSYLRNEKLRKKGEELCRKSLEKI